MRPLVRDRTGAKASQISMSNTPIICRCIARRKSSPARASLSTARPRALAAWVGGAAAAEPQPLYERLVAILKGMGKVFADETRGPSLIQGAAKPNLANSGLWPATTGSGRPATRRPPSSIPMRRAAGGKYVETLLEGFGGVSRSTAMTATTSFPSDRRGGPVTLAYCWAQCTRIFTRSPPTAGTPSLRGRWSASRRCTGSKRHPWATARRAVRRPSGGSGRIEDLKSWFEALPQARLQVVAGSRRHPIRIEPMGRLDPVPG